MVAGAQKVALQTPVSSPKESRNLNIGCGEFKKDGFLNLDRDPRAHPDVVHDLNQFPYPFAAESFDTIEADHILEHLKDPFGVMKEIHRILVNGGKLVVRVPHFSRGFTHAEHKCGFDITFQYYFNPTFPGGYTGTEFELQRLRMIWFAQPYLKKLVLTKPEYFLGSLTGKILDTLASLSPLACSRVWCFLVGGFEEVEFTFICRK